MNLRGKGKWRLILLLNASVLVVDLATAAEPKGVTASQRVREFADEPVCVSLGKFFCREELSLKISIVRNHIHSAKHEEGRKRLKAKELREKSIADALAAHNEDCHLKGETLAANQ